MNKNISIIVTIVVGIVLLALFINVQSPTSDDKTIDKTVNATKKLDSNAAKKLDSNAAKKLDSNAAKKLDSGVINTTEKLDSDTIGKDDKFLQWAEMVYENMNAHVSDVANATDADNYSAIEGQGKLITQDADIFLNQSTHFQISSELNYTLGEIQQSLEDYNITGKYLENGGKDRDGNSLMTAAEYAKQAGDHMMNASANVQNYKLTR